MTDRHQAKEEPAPPALEHSSWVEVVQARGRGALVSVAIFVLTIAAALLLVVPLIYIAGSDPLTAYQALFEGSVGSQRGIAETLVSATPLLLAGLAVAVAFQAGLFNIGAEGQLLMGGLASAVVATEIQLPAGIHLAAAIGAGLLGGALWGLVPGLLKAFRGVHEVITTIMFNFVAFSVSRYLVSPGGLLVSDSQPSATEKVLPTARFARFWDPTRLHTGIILAAAVTVLAWFFLYRSPLGYRFRFVGAKPKVARYAGISSKRVTVQAMLLSGALAGLAGAVEVLGLHGRYFDAFSPGYGFDAIGVALLGLLNPIGVAAAAVVFGMLRAGSVMLQSVANITRDMITVITGSVVGLVAARVAILRWIGRRRGGVAAVPPEGFAAEIDARGLEEVP